MDTLEEKETYSRSPVSKIASVSSKQVLDHLRNLQANSEHDQLSFLIVQRKKSPDVSCFQPWILIKYIQFQKEKMLLQV